jgi:hypothetical protein
MVKENIPDKASIDILLLHTVYCSDDRSKRSQRFTVKTDAVYHSNLLFHSITRCGYVNV